MLVEFDGHRFREPSGGGMACLEMAYRARRGDPSAIAVLTAFRVTIRDIHDKRYWPPQDDEPTGVTPEQLT